MTSTCHLAIIFIGLCLCRLSTQSASHYSLQVSKLMTEQPPSNDQTTGEKKNFYPKRKASSDENNGKRECLLLVAGGIVDAIERKRKCISNFLPKHNSLPLKHEYTHSIRERLCVPCNSVDDIVLSCHHVIISSMTLSYTYNQILARTNER
jgi:hypothetical protein